MTDARTWLSVRAAAIRANLVRGAQEADAEDLAHDGVVLALERAAKPGLAVVAARHGFLHALRHRRVEDRARPKLARSVGTTEGCPVRVLLDAEAAAERARLLERVRAEIASLTPRPRQVALALLDGLTHDEIAERLGIARRSVYVAAHRARRTLQRNLRRAAS